MTTAQQPSKVDVPIFTMKLDVAVVQHLLEQAKIHLFSYAAESPSFFTGFESAIIKMF